MFSMYECDCTTAAGVLLSVQPLDTLSLTLPLFKQPPFSMHDFLPSALLRGVAGC